MKHSLKSALVFLIGSIGAVTSAFGAAGSLMTTVTRLSDPVSYSDPGTNFFPLVGYAVTVKNDNGNTINNIKFTATTEPGASPGSLAAVYFAASGTNCSTTNTAGTAISCSIGQLKAGVSAPTFYIFFTAPADPDAAATPNNVFLQTTTLYAEQTNDSNSVPQNSAENVNADLVELGTPSPNNIKSAVPKLLNSVLTLFTAKNPAGDLTDQISTFVTLPSNVPNATTLNVQETALASDNTDCVAAGNFVRCYQSDITIPNLGLVSGQYLSFELRIDPAAISSQLKTNQVRVNYDGSDIGFCVVTSASGAPIVTYASLPCVTSIVYYKNKGVKGWTPELDGVLVVKVINDENGTLKVF